ncbi:MAG: hypothetical protein Q9179_007978 [Wetmoreana sp. 5 TL-2023]
MGGNGAKKRKINRPSLNVQAYLDPKPPESTWEAKVEYRRIGKAPGSNHDNIFLISALNHHISILNIPIPDQYLEYITNGSAADPAKGSSVKDFAPDFNPASQEWWLLQVKRSKWYDLLIPEERAEAMRGVWGACGWCMRDTGGG